MSGSRHVRDSPTRGRALLLALALALAAAVAWVYARPYMRAVGESPSGSGVATFTVDEALYLTEAKAWSEGRDGPWNPWTREFGEGSDAYRRFPGALLFAAVGWRLDTSPTGWLGAAGAASAVSAAVLLFLLLGAALGRRDAPALLLAASSVVLPWGRIGEIVRLRARSDLLTDVLPLARPFTTQWGPVCFLLGLWCASRALARPSAGRLALLAAALAAQYFTFPYALPVTVALYGAIAFARARGEDEGVRPLALRLLPLLVLPILALHAGATTAPAAAEAAEAAVAAPRFGGTGVLLLALTCGAWAVRRRFRPPHDVLLPALGLTLSLARLADLVLPARWQTSHHVDYVTGLAVALLASALLLSVLPNGRRALGAVAASALFLAACLHAAHASERCYDLRRDENLAQEGWARALASPPEAKGGSLLTEGEALDGPGAWAGLYSPLPVFYAVTAEYSTTPSLDDRLWRRAWYHHFRGLDAGDLAGGSAEALRRFPRLMGAHNNVPDPRTFERLRDRLREIEEGRPDAMAFLRSRAPLVCLEAADASPFDASRLLRVLSPVRRVLTRGFAWTVYDAR